MSFDLRFANTFRHNLHKTVTFYDVGTPQHAAASTQGFAKIAAILVADSLAHSVVDVYSDRGAPLASQHFLTITQFDVQIPEAAQWI